MRSVIVTLVAAAVAGLAVSADAATASKKKQRSAASKDKTATDRRPREKVTPDFGYMASPENYPVGSDSWWQAMERHGRGGFGNIP